MLTLAVDDTIEAGERTTVNVIWNGNKARASGSVKPYGRWGARGTTHSKEVIEESLNQ